MANRVPVTVLGCLMWTPRLFDYLDPEEAESTTIWLGASISKSWKTQRLSNATAESPNR